MINQIFDIQPAQTKCFLVVFLALAQLSSAAFADRMFSPKDLVGLWSTRKVFGPEIKGELTIEKRDGAWRAEIAGHTVEAKMFAKQTSFELPDELGSFKGWFMQGRLQGHWIQPRTLSNGLPYATPVDFEKVGRERWQGLVNPKEDAMTFYLPIKMNNDSSLSAYLRNPERNLGRFIDVQHVSCDGHAVKFLGFPSPRDSNEVVLLEGNYDAGRDVLSIYIPERGGTYDFQRASTADEKKFYPRGKLPIKYAYTPPPLEHDGWEVGSLDEVGISRDSISNFVQMLINMPMESMHTSDIHGFLLARHGKLVIEEYFHGFHRDALHDTRSAAKSLTSLLTGAAILQGKPLSLTTPVYEAMYGSAELNSIDPRKKAITVENLLTMSSGLDCDDSDPDSKGNEDIMQDQSDQPDWYRYTLDQKMVRNPGEKAVYGSANPNLLGGVLSKTTGTWLPDLFQDLIAEPLQIHRYAMDLTPTLQAYMGGGVEFRPRDFMKLGQVMLDGGSWHGKRIVSTDWAKKSTQPLYDLAGIKYGYLWYVTDWPYKGRTVQAFFAGGNGGQVVIGVPELDLVVAFYGGSYSDKVFFVPQRVFVPDYILPAVN